ncbi:amino acid transporter [Gonapodya prolifera JEL478]|uniref:Amino acid transporter n=1 Tax=Gonapodya prolifera (strain JEL478) TaxID=1344416 RepID=A0A139ALP0_GONPJ|nr:amino acid transporter [Gonapodya prolifera JEL478]|eukprot:KXS17474.1 amino acid transporter [Gonapodya prolifera JEL478]
MSAATLTEDEIRLAKLGYRQELSRTFTAFHSFGISFSIISIPTGILPLVGYALLNGGAVAMTWGWILVFFMVLTVAGSLAEICSTYPTAGSLYFWSAKLTGEHPQWTPFAAWITGWFNLLGEVGLVAGVAYTFASVLAATCTLTTDWVATLPQLWAIYVGVLVFCALLNTLGDNLLTLFTTASVVWHMATTFLFIVVVPAKAATHQDASFVFTEFNNESGFSDFYGFCLGLLLSQWTISGYDASAHMSEETHGSHNSAPWGIIYAVLSAFVFGWALILSLLFSIQDLDATVAGGYTAIWLAALDTNITVFFQVLFLGCIFFCTMSCITSNSRMIYAFSRDGALPFSNWIHHIDPKSKMPVRAIIVSTSLATILAVPGIWSSVALTALISIGTIGQYISYGCPIFFKAFFAGSSFKQSSFNLGPFSRAINIIAVLWIGFIAIIFCFPSVYPVTWGGMNFAPFIVGFVIVFAGGWWLISARKWFKGPVIQVTEEEIAEIDRQKKEEEPLGV